MLYKALAKKTGVDIDRVQRIENRNGQTANAQYDAKNNKITVSASAQNEWQANVHEYGHYGFAYNPEKMKAVKKAVMDYVLTNNSEAEVENMLRQYAESYEGADRADIEEEFVCDALGGMFSTEEGVQQFLDWLQNESGYNANEKKTILQKIAEWLNDIIEAIRDILNDGELNGAGKLFAKEKCDELTKIRKMFLEAIDGATVNYREKGAVEGEARYSLSSNAKEELHKALYDKNYRNEVLLRDETPPIMLSQKGVKNHKMVMNASHIRENVFTEEEARNLGLKVDKHTHYHGIGEDFFLKIIDSLDNVTEAYRGTKNARDSLRRENYFLLVTEFKDEKGNIINVPVFIDELAQCNRVFIETNKIATVFGREGFREYINRQIRDKNLIRIKNKNSTFSEGDAIIAPAYESAVLKDSISDSTENVNDSSKFSLPLSNLNELNASNIEKVTELSKVAAQLTAHINYIGSSQTKRVLSTLNIQAVARQLKKECHSKADIHDVT